MAIIIPNQNQNKPFLVDGIQNHLKNEEYRKYSCFVLSLLKWVEIAFNEIRIHTEKELDEWITHLKDLRWVGANCWVIHPAMVFNVASERPRYFLDNSIQTEIPYTLRFPVFYNGSPTHFALGAHDGKGGYKIVFDSWAPSAESRGRKPDHFRSFR